MKMREKLNIPSNIRAVEAPTRRYKRRKRSTLREQILLDYINHHRGEKMQMVDLARAIDGSPSGACTIIKRLTDAGEIRRIKRPGQGYSYVRIVQVPQRSYTPKEMPPRIPQLEPMTPIEAKEIPRPTAPVRTSNGEVEFVKLLDNYIWEYLRGKVKLSSDPDVSRAIGDATQTLVSFSQYMHDKQENPNGTTQETDSRGSSAPSSNNQG